jgi:Ni/Co efflux regulator RcnB
MKLNIAGGLIIAALAVTSIANAQTRTPVINARQHNQERRINQGVRSGQLTRNETRHLRNDERRIRSEKQAYKASGRVTAAERTHLRHQENRTSRAIYRDKHNNRVR